MEVAFFAQPFAADRSLGAFLEEILASARSFWALTAWAQLSGLRLMERPLRGLRDRGAPCEMILGIDGGIATRESLELAIDLFDVVRVFHDPGTRTYHPKIYCAESHNEAHVIIGSSNLTEGGLYRNYEANALVRLTPGRDPDDTFLAHLLTFRAQLCAEGMPCRELDRELIEQLALDGTMLRSEGEREEEERVTRARAASIARRIFGEVDVQLSDVPGRAGPGRAGGSVVTRRPRRPAHVRGPSLRWWKELTRSDAIRKQSTSHQRNYVILGKARHDIDQKTWFRDTFFAEVPWHQEEMRTGNVKEVSEVTFQVAIEDENIGTYSLRIDHAPNRISNQNNAPTWLHWSELLDIIRRQDFTGWCLILERAAGRYRLHLSRTPPREPV